MDNCDRPLDHGISEKLSKLYEWIHNRSRKNQKIVTNNYDRSQF